MQALRGQKFSQGDCCAFCHNTTGCNVWVWCPSFEVSRTGCMLPKCMPHCFSVLQCAAPEHWSPGTCQQCTQPAAPSNCAYSSTSRMKLHVWSSRHAIDQHQLSASWTHLQGCMYSNGTIFPTYACDLKNQPNLIDPTQAPLAFSRGPPTPFTSGKFRLQPIRAPAFSL